MTGSDTFWAWVRTWMVFAAVLILGNATLRAVDSTHHQLSKTVTCIVPNETTTTTR